MPQKRACSRVISVRYDTGCYRHLRIPSSRTLEGLADAILEAFGSSMAMPTPFSWTTAAGQGRAPTGWTWGTTIGNGRKRKKDAPPADTHWTSWRRGSRSSSSLILAKTGASSASPCARWGDCDDARLLRTKGGAAQAVRAARGPGRRGRWNLTPYSPGHRQERGVDAHAAHTTPAHF